MAESMPPRFEIRIVKDGDTRRHQFEYMGRSHFRILWRQISEIEDKAGLAIQGVQGFSKSHLLAAATVLALSKYLRCVYITDAHQLVRSFVTCMRDALVLAYVDDEEVLREVEDLVTVGDLPKFVGSRKRSREFYFIIDNWDALHPQEGSIAGEAQK